MASVAAELRARCERIAQTDDAGSGSLAHIEPALVELVEFSRAALSTNRSELVGSFCALVRDPTMPDELLLFTMHMLRFPEVLGRRAGM